ncbi:MAG: CapA family protein [Eubacterium sp.]|nr:CapA family protein [Eubacterium sp.]
MNKKKLIPVLIPFIAAVIVVCALAVSGKVAKTANINPTATKIAAVEKTTEETTLPKKSKVTLIAVGDNLIHNTLIDAGEQDDGTLDYNSFYEDIRKYVQEADIAVINQETMLGGDAFEYSGYPMFNTPWEVGEAAINAGFDVFTCATNHTMDKGSAGIAKELEFFAQHPEVVHLGTFASEEDYNKITYYEKNDIKFALLNYTYGTNGIPIPEDKPYVVKMLTEENVRKDIAEARKNADFVIVFPHWGTENSHEVNSQQRKYIKIFSELGVDMVIGTHPHVLQKVEWVTNETSGKKMLVYYSIGNFISHQVNLNQMCGGMAEVTIERNGDEISITNAKLAPVIDFYTNTGSGYRFSVYKLSDYTDDLAEKQAQGGATVKYFTNLSKEVISEEFLDLE